MLDNLGILVDIEILVYLGALDYLGSPSLYSKEKGICLSANPFMVVFKRITSG